MAEAQTRLAHMYFEGYGVPQDLKEGVKWFRLAADQGNAEALGCFGALYAYGIGVPENKVAGYALFSIAAAKDNTAVGDAVRDSRAALARNMTERDIKAGQDLAAKTTDATSFCQIASSLRGTGPPSLGANRPGLITPVKQCFAREGFHGD